MVRTPCLQMLCGGLDGRGSLGRGDTCTCMTESLCCQPETITTLLISFTPMQNIKSKKKKRTLCLKRDTVNETISPDTFKENQASCLCELA